jgi:hypothetical protein
MYIQSVIERIEAEKAVHERKFKNNPVHKNCLPRFDQTLAKLRAELAKLGDRES